MEEKRQIVLYLLLLTLSSVMGLDCPFSKKVYDAILEREEKAKIITGTTSISTTHVEYSGLDHELKFHMCDMPYDSEGVSFSTMDETVELTFSEDGPQRKRPLMAVTLRFSKVLIDEEAHTFGVLELHFGFHDQPHRDFMRNLVFSPARNDADKDYVERITVPLNPFTKEQVQITSKSSVLNWKLSSLQPLLSSTLNSIKHHDGDGATILLKPIIVDEDLLKDLYNLAHPRGIVHKYLPLLPE